MMLLLQMERNRRKALLKSAVMKTERLETQLETQLRMLLDRGVGLPGELFTDQKYFAIERERLFMRSWLCVGLSSDVPRHGTAYPVDILNVPLLMVRDGGVLRVFHNVCSHRGARLVNEPCGGRVRVVCPYHGWTYGLDGSLLKTPHVAGAKLHQHKDWDPRTLGLVCVRSAEWAGHVFVDLSGEAEPFDRWIEPISARLALPTDANLARDQALKQRLELAADWKIIVENFVESYHLPWVHQQLNRVNPMERHYQILGGHHYLGQGGDDYEGQQLYGTELPTFRQGSKRSDYEALYIFPNLILGPFADFMFSIIIQPVAAGRSRERIEFFFAGADALAESHRETRQRSAQFLIDINREDVGIVESVQRGRSSPAFRGGQFSIPQEATSLQFQKMVAAKLLAQAGQRGDDVVQLPTLDIRHPEESSGFPK